MRSLDGEPICLVAQPGNLSDILTGAAWGQCLTPTKQTAYSESSQKRQEALGFPDLSPRLLFSLAQSGSMAGAWGPWRFRAIPFLFAPGPRMRTQINHESGISLDGFLRPSWGPGWPEKESQEGFFFRADDPVL
jgi:hypothetical protein